MVAWSRRYQLCNNFSAIRHQHGLAGSDFANILAEPVLQIPQAYALHVYNVAS
jgi:hypothetical protein